jgi:hypothetical protein
LNRGSRFCRPLPYHLATAPVGTVCREIPAASRRSNNSARNDRSESSSIAANGLPTETRRVLPGPPPRRGVGTVDNLRLAPARRLERETGFEPATSTLARSHSTTELFPLFRRKVRVPQRSLRNQGARRARDSCRTPGNQSYTPLHHDANACLLPSRPHRRCAHAR